MLKPKFQHFGHLMQTDESLEKSLLLGKIKDRRRRGHQRMIWLGGITSAMNMNFSKLWEMGRARQTSVLQSVGSQRVGHNCVTDQQQTKCSYEKTLLLIKSP